MSKQYYSVRTGKNTDAQHFGLDVLRRLFSNLYIQLHGKGYFDEYFGYYCTDEGRVPGRLGDSIEAEMYRLLRKNGLWPIRKMVEDYSEDDLFDVIEFLFDNISKPIDGYPHDWNNCGMHYTKFDKAEGQAEYREAVNQMLNDYETGYELDANGLIVVKEDSSVASLYTAEVPTTQDDIKTKIDIAVKKYRSSRSNLEERRIAIRELADILEKLRPEAKQYLHDGDENDLFNIANQFGLRHSNDKQKINYDRDIWFSWMFYFYLATIHALLRIIERAKKNPN